MALHETKVGAVIMFIINILNLLPIKSLIITNYQSYYIVQLKYLFSPDLYLKTSVVTSNNHAQYHRVYGQLNFNPDKIT